MKQNKVKARTPSGFLELLPQDQKVFNWMFKKIANVFELFGYLPIETPAVELKEVLLAKGGGETEKQVYRLASKTGETDMCLHFDLTVPLARYVVEHFNELTFPFRRYQMQKVWRGEGAQKGRYREFYQCDIDVIGTTNPMTDAEIPSVIYRIFQGLQIPPFTIGLNNRKLVCGIFETFADEGLTREFLVLADKLPKIGNETFVSQLIELGVDKAHAEFMLKLLSFKGSYLDLVEQFPDWKNAGELVREGLRELQAVYEGVLSFGVPTDFVRIDLSIVRGLDYYTGTVYETMLNDFPEIGSICSGGRYDNLCGYYTDKNLPGVGISIGMSRLFYQLKAAGLLPKITTNVAKALIIAVDDSAMSRCVEVANKARMSEINCEVYLEKAKVQKQLKYANSLGIPFVILIGENEMKLNSVTVKNMNTGIQLVTTLQGALSLIDAESQKLEYMNKE